MKHIQTVEELLLLHSITQSIIESKDFDSALEITLQKICESTGWIYGESWMPSADGTRLEYGKAWFSNNKKIERFKKESESFEFLSGAGLPGRVWSSKKPEWISIISNGNFPRKQFAIDAGLKTAIGIPIIDKNNVIAVICFITSEILEKDEQTIEFISNIALQLGVFFNHKKTKDLLHKSEREIRTILDNIPDIFYRTNKDGQFIMISNAVKGILGYEPEELIGKRVADLYADPDERSKFLKKLEESGGRINGYEALLKRKDGSYIWVSTNAQYYTDENGNIAGVEGIVRDITEHKKLEDELLKTQKLEAIGLLAGGIAHDFNNLLTAIVGNIGLSKMYLQPDNKIFDWLTTAEKACGQAKELSSRLITFSKGGLPIKNIISMPDLIREAISELLNGTNILCECNFQDDLYPAKIDKMQIKQVIRNVIINAKEAMSNGGFLKIDANNITITKKDNLPLKEWSYIKLSIEDNGKGIEEENLAKIFDPYFTTKAMGSEKGSGLGLSICHSIIKKHDGLITVDSKAEAGTTVKIYLPSAAK